MSVQPTWSIVLTSKASPLLLKAFVAHHLSIGVSQIDVFLDDPHDKALEFLQPIPRVKCHPCNAEHWAKLGMPRPPDHRARQMVNANLAKRTSTAEWIAHIDTDEFLLPKRSVAEMLAAVPGDADSVRVEVCENAFLTWPTTLREVFQGPFKKALPRSQDGLMADSLLNARLRTYRNMNFQGHLNGKVFVRVGSDSRFLSNHLSISEPDWEKASAKERTKGYVPKLSMLAFQQDSVELLHFFILGYADWCGKYLRRLNPDRKLQPQNSTSEHWELLRTAAQNGEEAVRDLFRATSIIDARAMKILRRMNNLIRPELHLERKVIELFGPGPHGFDDPLPEFRFDELQRILQGFAEGA